MKQRRDAKGTTAKGFDFGTPARQVHLADMTWTEHLASAGIVGCAYGIQDVEGLGPIPVISLVAQNEARMREAFESFDAWTEGSDDDAVDVTIVFLKSGGYLLGISPESDRLQARSPVSPLLDPIRIQQIWVKPMDTTDRLLKDLRDYRRRLFAPVGFGAVLMVAGGAVPSRGSVRPLAGLRTFVKFALHIVHEDEDAKPAIADMMLGMHAKGRSRGRPATSPASADSPADWAAKRRRALRGIFPLTLFRGRSGGLLDRVRAEFPDGACATWQIEQAVCNVALSRVLDPGGPHFATTAPGRLFERVLEVVRTRREIAGGAADCSAFPPTEVAAQLRLDARHLANAIGERLRDGSFPAVQAVLRRRGHLGPD